MPRDRGRKPGETTKSHGQRNREHEVDVRIDRLLNPQDYEDGKLPEWVTDKDAAESGELFSFEDLVAMKPFKIEDLNSLISFRANASVFRATQRIKERAGGVYDIMSDLQRDIYMLGLIILSQRYEDILGGEIIISRAQGRVMQGKEIFEQVRRLGEALYSEGEDDRRADYLAFVEMIRKKPIKVTERYLAAMETNPLLSELRKRMVEIAKAEEQA